VRRPGGRKRKSWVFYGKSGTGKTTVAASFPKKMLYLNIKDEGDDSISDIEGLDVMDIRSVDDLEMAYWWLYKHPGKYVSVVLDTMSQLQQMVVREVIAAKTRTSKQEGKEAGDWGSMSKREWGDVAAKMKVWITNFRDLDVDCIFIAQDRTFNLDDESESESTLDPEVGPALSPSIAKHLNASVHFIGNTFIRRRTVTKVVKIPSKVRPGKFIEKKQDVDVIEYCMRVGPNPVYITKIRKPKAIVPPSVIVDPSYEALTALVKKEE
jgi:hypothetical protein